MRKIFYLLFFLLVGGFIFWERESLINNSQYLFSTPCSRPITYRLGQVDPGYGKSEEEFLSQVKSSAEIWDKAYGQPLFVYDPQAEMAVNLIYTERQLIMDKLSGLEGDLQSGRGSLEALEAEFKRLSADFEVRLEKFNREVEFWNQKQGAPPEEYDRLIKQQADLEVESVRLNQMAEQLNLKVKDYNLQVGEFNQSVQVYNVITEQKPEAGLYDGSVPKIDIYLTVSEAELVHTLAHEFGHALELDHVDNPRTIMYPFSNEIIEPAPEEIEMLKEICSEIRFSKLLKIKLAEIKKSLNNLNEN